MTAYYNEIDPYAAQWLRNLIAAGHIAPGEVDERSIVDVRGSDLAGFTQCHFFAGIGGWSLALRLAGWKDERPVWTGSCPCQPYSVASLTGEGAQGQSDVRHLWPHFFGLIREQRPGTVLGEQVASAIAWGWWDEAALDMEGQGYACAAAVLRSDAFGAAHERKRLYWVADSGSAGRQGSEQHDSLLGGEKSPQSKFGDPFVGARTVLAGDTRGLRIDDGLPVGVGRSRIHGYGNAIVPQVAAAFIQALP